jgi:ribosomal protein L7/L12
MTKQEFDNLAERVLVALVQVEAGATAHFVAQHAVKITDEFVKALNRRHMDLAQKTTTLVPEEILLLQAQPHPEVIKCIAAVRTRTNMNLKECKDLVDKCRSELGLL